MWDGIIALSFLFSVIVVWFQRKTIFELERDVWEIEKAYKEKTGIQYQYKHRLFQGWRVKEDGE